MRMIRLVQARGYGENDTDWFKPEGVVRMTRLVQARGYGENDTDWFKPEGMVRMTQIGSSPRVW